MYEWIVDYSIAASQGITDVGLQHPSGSVRLEVWSSMETVLLPEGRRPRRRNSGWVIDPWTAGRMGVRTGGTRRILKSEFIHQPQTGEKNDDRHTAQLVPCEPHENFRFGAPPFG